MRRWPLLIVLALVMLALVPSVHASHTMGHRYLVFGRLLGGDGMPVQNQPVTLKIMDRGNSLASIVTQTDCLGDFESWEGQAGNDPPGGGMIEPNQHPQHGRYLAFHFHDSDLSNRYDVLVIVGDETKTLDFHSRDRQTAVREQLAATFEPACAGYDEFERSFTVRTSVLNQEELSYRTEAAPKPRLMNFTIEDAQQEGRADFNGAFRADFENITPAVGDVLQLQVEDVGGRTQTLSEKDVQFRRVDISYVVGESVGSAFSGLKIIGGALLVGAVLVGLYFGTNRLRDKMAEKRLRETSTRRRFRRENK